MDGLLELVQMSNFYGENEDYVLGGGGNTSYKDKEKGIMYVKASGYSLADITEGGFAAMDMAKLAGIMNKSYPEEDALRERMALEDLMSARMPGEEKRPSVETLLHALLPQKFVLHLHPTAVNGLTCSKEVEYWYKLLNPDCIYIPLTKPGYTLAAVCKKEIDKYVSERGQKPYLLLLQNHGLFISADTVEELHLKFKDFMNMVEAQLTRRPPYGLECVVGGMEKELRGLYGPDGYAEYYYMPALDILSDSRLAFENLDHAYTPDHIVYCGARPLYLENNDNVAGDFKDYVDRQGRPPKIVVINSGAFYALGSNVKAVRLAAQLFADQVRLLYYTHNFGGPNPLPEEFVHFIENWEIESYRSKVSTGV